MNTSVIYTPCYKLRKASCINSSTCTWVKGKGCKKKPNVNERRNVVNEERNVVNVGRNQVNQRNPLLDNKITNEELKNETDPLTLNNFKDYTYNNQKYLIKIGSQIYDARSLINSVKSNLDTTARAGKGYGQNPITRVAFTERQFNKILSRSRGELPSDMFVSSNNGKSVKEIVNKSRGKLGMCRRPPPLNYNNPRVRRAIEMIRTWSVSGVPLRYRPLVMRFQHGEIDHEGLISELARNYM